MASHSRNGSQCRENDFEYYLKFARPLVLALNDPNDRVKASAWVKRLKEEDISIEVRTVHLKLLIFALQQRRLIGPFKELPENVELSNIQEGPNILNIAHEIIFDEQQGNLNRFGSCDAGDLPPSFEISNDALEFASCQRIPHFGVQAFYAISREPLIAWDNLDTGLIPPAVITSLEDEASGILSGLTLKPTKSLSLSVKALSTKIKTPEDVPKPSISPPKGQVSLLGFIPPPCDERKPITWGSNLIELTESAPEPIEIPATPPEVADVPVEAMPPVFTPPRLALPAAEAAPPPPPRTPSSNVSYMPPARRPRRLREERPRLTGSIVPRRLFGDSYEESDEEAIETPSVQSPIVEGGPQFVVADAGAPEIIHDSPIPQVPSEAEGFLRQPPRSAAVEKSPMTKAREQMRMLYGEDRTPPFVREKSPMSKAREQMRLLYGEDRTPPFIREKSPMSKAREQMRLLYGEETTPPFVGNKSMMINIPTPDSEEKFILEEANIRMAEQDALQQQVQGTPHGILARSPASPDLFDRMVSALGDEPGILSEEEDILDEDLDMDLYTDLLDELKQLRALRSVRWEDMPVTSGLPMTSPTLPSTPTRRVEFGEELPLFEEEMPEYFTPEKSPRSKLREHMRSEGQRIPSHMLSPELDEHDLLKYVPPSPVHVDTRTPSPLKRVEAADKARKERKGRKEPAVEKAPIELIPTASAVENSKKLYDTLLSDERPVRRNLFGTPAQAEPAAAVEIEEVVDSSTATPPVSPEYEAYPEDLFGTAANVPHEAPLSLLDEGLPEDLQSPIRPPIVIPGWQTPEHLRIVKPKPMSPYLPPQLALPESRDYLWDVEEPEEFYSPEKPPVTPPQGPVMPSYEEYIDPFSEMNQAQMQFMDLEEEEEPLRYELEAHEMVPYDRRMRIVQTGGRAKRIRRRSAPPSISPISEEEEMYLLMSPQRSPVKPLPLLDFGASYMPPSSAPQRARGYYSSPVLKRPTSPIPLPWYPPPVVEIQEQVAPEQQELLTDAINVVKEIEKSPMTKVREQMRMLYGDEDVSPPFIGRPEKSPMTKARDQMRMLYGEDKTPPFVSPTPPSPPFEIPGAYAYPDLHGASPPRDFGEIDAVDEQPDRFDFAGPVEEFMPEFGAFDFDVGGAIDLEHEDMPLDVQPRMVGDSPERPYSPEVYDREEVERQIAALPSRKELYPPKFYYIRRGYRGGPFIRTSKNPSRRFRQVFNQLNPIRELPAEIDDDEIAAFNYDLEMAANLVKGRSRRYVFGLDPVSVRRPSYNYTKEYRLPGITEEIDVESPVKRGGRPGIAKRRKRIDFAIPESPDKPPVLSPRSKELADIMAMAENLPQEQVPLPEDLLGHEAAVQYTPPRTILDESISPDIGLKSPMKLPIQIPGWSTPEHLKIRKPKPVTPPAEDWIKSLGFPQSIRAEIPPDLFNEIIEEEYDDFDGDVHKDIIADFRRYPSGTTVETTDAVERPISAAEDFEKQSYGKQFERRWERMQEGEAVDLDVSMPDMEFLEELGEDERLHLAAVSPRTPTAVTPRTPPPVVSPRTPPRALQPSPGTPPRVPTSPVAIQEEPVQPVVETRQPFGYSKPRKPAIRKARASAAPAMPAVSEEEEMYLLASPIRSPVKPVPLIDYGAPYMPRSSAPQRARGYYSSPPIRLPTSPIPLRWHPSPEKSPMSKAREQMRMLYGEDKTPPFLESRKEKSPMTKAREQMRMLYGEDRTPPFISPKELSPISKARAQMRMLYGEDRTPPFIGSPAKPVAPPPPPPPPRSPYTEEDFQAIVPPQTYDLAAENLDFEAPEFAIEEEEVPVDITPPVSPLMGGLGEDFDVVSRTAFQYEMDKSVHEGEDIFAEEMPAFYSSPQRTPQRTPQGPITRPSPYLETTPAYTPPQYVPVAQFIDVDYPATRRPTQVEIGAAALDPYANVHPLDRPHPLEELLQLQPAVFDPDRYELNWESPEKVPPPLPDYVPYVPPPPPPPLPITPPRVPRGPFQALQDDEEPELFGSPVARANVFEREYFFGEDIHAESPPRMESPESPRYASPPSPRPVVTPPKGPAMMTYGEYMRSYSPSNYRDAPQTLALEVQSHTMVPYRNKKVIIQTGRRAKKVPRRSAAPRLETIDEPIPQSEMSPLSRAREQMRVLYGEDITPPFLRSEKPAPTAQGPARRGVPRRLF